MVLPLCSVVSIMSDIVLTKLHILHIRFVVAPGIELMQFYGFTVYFDWYHLTLKKKVLVKLPNISFSFTQIIMVIFAQIFRY